MANEKEMEELRDFSKIAYSQGWADALRTVKKETEENMWHDLREDPDDLPKENGDFIIYVQGNIYYALNNWTAERFHDYADRGIVIKWKYIK